VTLRLWPGREASSLPGPADPRNALKCGELEHQRRRPARPKKPANADSFSAVLQGRGELHLTILIENMRREGFELCVSRPR